MSYSDHNDISTILGLIDQSDLPESVKAEASAVFQRIGEAEAAIHGIDIEQIIFMKWAMDSIIDIVGCASRSISSVLISLPVGVYRKAMARLSARMAPIPIRRRRLYVS